MLDRASVDGMRQKLSMQAICVYGGLILLVAALIVIEWHVDAPPISSAQPTASTAAQRPATSDIQALFAGQKLYNFYCANCHGANAQGGSAASSLAEQLATGSASDDALYQTIEGRTATPAMPAFRTQLTGDQIWQLVAYLRTLSASSHGNVVLSSSLFTGTTPLTTTTALTSRTVQNLPEPLPSLVFVRRGNLWHSDGAAALLTQLTQFSAEGERANYVAYSATSGRIAFTTVLPPPNQSITHETAGALYTIKLDGSDKQLVWQTEAGELQIPAWTPDGATLYVAYITPYGETATDGRTHIVRIDLATSKRQTIVRSAHSPTISPDGQHLGYLAEQGYATSLVVARLDGSNTHTLLSGIAFSGLFAPRFTVDGTALLFTAVGGPETDSSGTPIAECCRTARERLLAWLMPPVAEAHSGGPQWDVWQVRLDETKLRRLTTLAEDLPMAVESPNGNELVVMAYGGLYRMQSDGNDVRRISLVCDHGAFDWVVPAPSK